jgi:hypothetical protein
MDSFGKIREFFLLKNILSYVNSTLFDPSTAPKPCFTEQGRGFLRVNPEQSPLLRLESRRVNLFIAKEKKWKRNGWSMSNVTMKELLEAGVHFGHETKRWDPKMKPYIFGARNGIYIIDLQKTVQFFKEAYQFVRDVAAKGEYVLFVGTKTGPGNDR